MTQSGADIARALLRGDTRGNAKQGLSMCWGQGFGKSNRIRHNSEGGRQDCQLFFKGIFQHETPLWSTSLWHRLDMAPSAGLEPATR